MNEYTFEEIKIGMKESFQVNITESMENTFAEISGNYNPLASDEEYAATTTYKKRICPGMFTASFFSRLTGMHLPGKYALVYSQSLNFVNICYIGDQITVEGEVIEKNNATKMITLNTIITNQEGKKLIFGKARVTFRKT
ncbi:MAG: enoyl-CoA hydratase [Thaumarchaeota archaeon]|nr:MAG: enoyl-CoA hydratase [Nitrososphaerota archaeon]